MSKRHILLQNTLIFKITDKFCPRKFWGQYLKYAPNWNDYTFPVSMESENIRLIVSLNVCILDRV